MNKKYFPGANTGDGFYSRFNGIIPPSDTKHYTYILKGGPGVGKNTLMKKIARKAAEKGYDVEEFRCASDEKSLDAVRIPELKTVLLDGTAPHSIDPVMPGIDEEIIDLGHFKNLGEFSTFRKSVSEFTKENKRRYRAAYAMLGAAKLLKQEAVNAAYDAINTEKLRSLIKRLTDVKKHGEHRRLFACSATPDGVMDFSPSFLPNDTIFFSGIVGEITMIEAEKLLADKCAEIFYGFVTPDVPHCIITGSSAIALGESGDSLREMYTHEPPSHISFCLEKADRLVKRAVAELEKALEAHDKIETLYRDYVDYDRVNYVSDILIKRIGV